jgi:hypothetical protein
MRGERRWRKEERLKQKRRERRRRRRRRGRKWEREKVVRSWGSQWRCRRLLPQ